MKKIIIGLMAVASIASADFIGASVGAGVWQENISGHIKTGDTINYFNNKAAETDGNTKTGNLGLSDKSQPYIWAKIIHPIPLIPNVKVQYTRYDTSGDGIATSNFKIFGQNINTKNKVHTDLTIDSYDATFFYEFKPVVVDLEAGVGVNVWKGQSTVISNNMTSSASWIVPFPYLYARAETTPFFGFSVEAQAKYLNVSIGHYYDYQGSVKYHLPLPLLDISLAVGYKSQDILGKDGGDETNIKFEGGFAELGVKW